jgi:hypothetical protein
MKMLESSHSYLHLLNINQIVMLFVLKQTNTF